MGDDGEGGGQGEDDLDEVWRIRRCWRNVSDVYFGRRGLRVGIGPLWRTEAQEAVLLVVVSAAAKTLPLLPVPMLLLLLLLPVTHLKAERRPARGYIQDKGTGK